MADTVRVHNKGTKDLSLAHDSKLTVVPAGGDGFIERECAIIHFGNPAVRNNPAAPHQDDRDARKMEYQRVLALYVSLGDGVSRDDLSVLPSAEVYELSGEKWTTVLEDPEGKTLPVQGAPEPEKENLIASMQSQIQRLQEQIDQATSQPIAVNEDTPRPAKMKRPAVVAADSDEE